MDETVIGPFIDATLHVLKTSAFVDVKAGKPYIKSDQIAQGDVSGLIGLTGNTKGSISVSFSEESILFIVSKMFSEEKNELNWEIQDAVGELTNIITGQARKQLSEQGMSFKAAIPTVIMGKNHSIAHVTSYPVIAIPFFIDQWKFTIEICFEEA